MEDGELLAMGGIEVAIKKLKRKRSTGIGKENLNTFRLVGHAKALYAPESRKK